MLCLLVEDHDDLAATVADFLVSRGFVVDHAYDLASASRRLSVHRFDALIVDRGLPDGDGLSLCRLVRGDPSLINTPILVLTARETLDDRLEGFAAGADDYLVKPFSLDELAARVTAMVRRSRPLATANVLELADLRFDVGAQQVTRAGTVLRLPPIGRRLLETLLRNQHRVVSREELERTIWGDEPPDSDALKSHLHQLRTVLDKPFHAALLHSVPGSGYRLIAPAEP